MLSINKLFEISDETKNNLKKGVFGSLVGLTGYKVYKNHREENNPYIVDAKDKESKFQAKKDEQDNTDKEKQNILKNKQDNLDLKNKLAKEKEDAKLKLKAEEKLQDIQDKKDYKEWLSKNKNKGISKDYDEWLTNKQKFDKFDKDDNDNILKSGYKAIRRFYNEPTDSNTILSNGYKAARRLIDDKE